MVIAKNWNSVVSKDSKCILKHCHFMRKYLIHFSYIIYILKYLGQLNNIFLLTICLDKNWLYSVMKREVVEASVIGQMNFDLKPYFTNNCKVLLALISSLRPCFLICIVWEITPVLKDCCNQYRPSVLAQVGMQ